MFLIWRANRRINKIYKRSLMKYIEEQMGNG